MYKTVIYLLVLYLTSARGRVALKDELLPDITKNVIADDAKPKVFVMELELPAIKLNEVLESVTTTSTPEPTATESCTTSTTEDPDMNTVPTAEKKEKDNKIDPNSEEDAKDSKEDIDVGVAVKLTPMLNDKLFQAARNASRVNPDLFLGIESYAGYFTVNKTYDSNLFFWYFPVEKKPVNETPWVIWLQGGPGASSMTGLFDEIGPFTVVPNGDLVRNPFSWLRNHSLLFFDNPVGTGFSYTNSPDGYTKDMDTYGNHLWSALQQFLQVFPELRSAPLYIAGESYAGKYVPVLAMHVHQNPGHANLQGLITGNAYVDPAMISQMTRPFYYFGLMEPEQVELVKPLIDAFQKDIQDKNSVDAKEKWNSLITVLLMITHQRHAYNFLRDDLSIGRYIGFLNKPEIKRAIHVGNIHFSYVNMTVNMRLSADFLSSTKNLYEELLDHYRLLTYCGQLDQMLSCVLTSENYRTWRWSGAGEFLDAVRHPFIYNNRLAGYHKSGGHLTEVVIRGAGHMAPLDAPAPVAALVAAWTHHRSLGRLSLLEGSFIQDYIRNNSLPASVHYL